jgi:hypothetical protein
MSVNVGEKELSQIRNIAFRELMDSTGSIYEPLDRDLLMIRCLKIWLEQKGVACEWTVDE